MLIHSFLFDREALAALEGVPDHVFRVAPDRIHGIGFNITETSEISAAGLAFRDGVVGVIVGQFEDGRPAFRAFE